MIGAQIARWGSKADSGIGWTRPNWHQRAVVSADGLAAFVAPREMLDELSAKCTLVIHDLPAFSSLCRSA